MQFCLWNTNTDLEPNIYWLIDWLILFISLGFKLGQKPQSTMGCLLFIWLNNINLAIILQWRRKMLRKVTPEGRLIACIQAIKLTRRCIWCRLTLAKVSQAGISRFWTKMLYHAVSICLCLRLTVSWMHGYSLIPGALLRQNYCATYCASLCLAQSA